MKRLKAVVSRKGIKREIDIARKKLHALEHGAAPERREVILRQLLQLELCDKTLMDVFLI